MTLVVSGASGSGKSTIGSAVAALLGWTFGDADTFHGAANIAKMSAGHSLDDADRAGWLAALSDWIGQQERRGQSCVLACSALRRAYRDRLRTGHDSVLFVQLVASPATLRARLEDRLGHFMPASMLPDQLTTLEPLQPDEAGFIIDAAGPPDAVTAHIRTALSRGVGRR